MAQEEIIKDEELPTEEVAAPPVGGKPAGPQVLDFEAEIIEGERRNSSLFLQMQVANPNLDTVIFQRSHFNDFHDIEKNRKPVYRNPRKRVGQ